jgi:BirA family biotin operon repressor/biotin-[acetyl-CoA-carboxylase] ligase
MKTITPNIIHIPELASTNAYAKQLLEAELPPEGTVIITDFQTAGKGQDTNSWESSSGENILMTIILYPKFLDISEQFSLSMAIALGIIDFLETLLPGIPLHIKWPNDIYAEHKKIGGILINNEIMGNAFRYVIAGIGININQLSFSKEIPNPVSIKELSGLDHDPFELAKNLSNHLLARYAQMDEAIESRHTEEYHAKLLGIHTWRKYIHQGKKINAKIKGVNEFGHLLLETETEEISCDLGEITFLF